MLWERRVGGVQMLVRKGEGNADGREEAIDPAAAKAECNCNERFPRCRLLPSAARDGGACREVHDKNELPTFPQGKLSPRADCSERPADPPPRRAALTFRSPPVRMQEPF